MRLPPGDLRAKLDAGRASAVADLRRLAARLEQLPLDDVGEALAWIAPHLDTLNREAERILRPRA